MTSIHNYDYRSEGKPQLICTNANGKGNFFKMLLSIYGYLVKGYVATH